QYRKSILNDKKEIEITDFGAGSRIFNDNRRRICDLGKHAGARANRMKLMYRIIQFLKPKNILELGTSTGLATASMAIATMGKVTSVEGCPAVAQIAREKLNFLKIDHLQLKIQRFEQFFENENQEMYDFVYIDGNHSKQATLNYFENLLPILTSNSILIFDDIYWSPGMTQAWEIIKEHDNVKFTIDCFWLGLVFLGNKEITGDFKVRL
ncbi:MAG: class I SAM-dependent methyltransferase, partial [Leeuwenhoekiella sp.]